MKKIYIHSNGYIYEYALNFNNNNFIYDLNSLYHLQLENNFFKEKSPNIIIESKTKIKTNILNTSNLINYLKFCFIDNDIIELKELYKLINSNNSHMRTPQTMVAISHVLENINFFFLNKRKLDEYNDSFAAACRKGLIDSRKVIDIVNISLINEKVFDSLFIKFDKEHVKTITK